MSSFRVCPAAPAHVMLALYLPLWGVKALSLGTILLIVLVLCLIGAFPTWPHSAHWGYYPSSGLGLILIIVVVLVVLGRI